MPRRSKRDTLARVCNAVGLTAFLGALPTRDCLLVLNYHRIGDPALTPLDPGVFTATAEGLYEQVRQIRRKLAIVNIEEAIAFVGGRDTAGGTRVLITFDDGYLDNYELAFPILKGEGASAVFFLVTQSIGSNQVQWWDRIAWFLGQARRRRFRLEQSDIEFDLDRDGLPASRERALQAYKTRDASSAADFLQELEAESDAPALPGDRLFLDWDEAREMSKGGMSIGSHTCSHPILSSLSADEQKRELVESRAQLGAALEQPILSLAYPVGSREAFTPETEDAARQAGYEIAFSFYGGFNHRGDARPFDLRRHTVNSPDPDRFRFQLALAAVSGNRWF